jgi:hypothetical protein
MIAHPAKDTLIASCTGVGITVAITVVGIYVRMTKITIIAVSACTRSFLPVVAAIYLGSIATEGILACSAGSAGVGCCEMPALIALTLWMQRSRAGL